MPLENATYIADLVVTNPDSEDYAKFGDDHIRLLKTVLKNTFRNANRPLDFNNLPTGGSGGSTTYYVMPANVGDGPVNAVPYPEGISPVPINVRANDAFIGSRPYVNFKSGAGGQVTAVDDPGNEEIEITLGGETLHSTYKVTRHSDANGENYLHRLQQEGFISFTDYGWSVSNGSLYTEYSRQVSGESCLLLICNGSGDATVTTFNQNTRYTLTGSPSTITLSAYVSGNFPNPAFSFFVNWYDNSGNLLSTSTQTSFALTGTMVQYSYSPNVPSNAVSFTCGFKVTNPQINWQVYLDYFVVRNSSVLPSIQNYNHSPLGFLNSVLVDEFNSFNPLSWSYVGNDFVPSVVRSGTQWRSAGVSHVVNQLRLKMELDQGTWYGSGIHSLRKLHIAQGAVSCRIRLPIDAPAYVFKFGLQGLDENFGSLPKSGKVEFILTQDLDSAVFRMTYGGTGGSTLVKEFVSKIFPQVSWAQWNTLSILWDVDVFGKITFRFAVNDKVSGVIVEGDWDNGDYSHLSSPFDRYMFAFLSFEPSSDATADNSGIFAEIENFKSFQRASGLISTRPPVASSPSNVTIKKNNSIVGTRQAINLIEGANVTISGSDDNINGEIDITIAAIAASGGSMPQVVSYANLRAVTGMEDKDLYFVQGRTAVGDGGTGIFRYEAGSALQDNAGTIIAPNSGSGRWIRVFTGSVNAKWFATGDGVTDDTIPLRACVDYARSIKSDVYIPGGTYLINGVSPNSDGFRNGILIPFHGNAGAHDPANGLKIYGAGTATILKAGNNNVCLIRISTDFVVIRDLTIDGGGINRNGIGILIGPEDLTQITTQTSNVRATIQRVFFQSNALALRLQCGPSVFNPDRRDSFGFWHTIDNCDFIGNKIGIKPTKASRDNHLDNDGFPDHFGALVTRCTVSNCRFNGTYGVSDNYGIYLEAGETWTITDCRFEGFNTTGACGLYSIEFPEGYAAWSDGSSAWQGVGWICSANKIINCTFEANYRDIAGAWSWGFFVGNSHSHHIRYVNGVPETWSANEFLDLSPPPPQGKSKHPDQAIRGWPRVQLPVSDQGYEPMHLGGIVIQTKHSSDIDNRRVWPSVDQRYNGQITYNPRVVGAFNPVGGADFLGRRLDLVKGNLSNPPYLTPPGTVTNISSVARYYYAGPPEIEIPYGNSMYFVIGGMLFWSIRLLFFPLHNKDHIIIAGPEVPMIQPGANNIARDRGLGGKGIMMPLMFSYCLDWCVKEDTTFPGNLSDNDRKKAGRGRQLIWAHLNDAWEDGDYRYPRLYISPPMFEIESVPDWRYWDEVVGYYNEEPLPAIITGTVQIPLASKYQSI